MLKKFLPAVLPIMALAISGCGQAKDRDEKVVYVENAGGKAQVSSSELSTDLGQLQQFIELYFEGDTISRRGMANLFTKYKDKIIPFLKGMNISADELIDILFSFDRNGDGKLGVSELADEVARRIPILRWIKDNSTSITPEELLSAIRAEYPAAAHGTCVGLQNTLLRFDERFAGGNADGRISRKEISAAGLALAVVAQVDFTKPVTLPKNAPLDEKLALEQLERMLDQQIYGRHVEFHHKELAVGDLSLEWAQFYLQSDLIERLVRGYGVEGELSAQAQVAAMSAYGFKQQPHWAAGRALFDHKMMGGDGNGRLNFSESIVYLGQFKYASKIWSLTGGDFSFKNIGKLEGRKRLLWSLVTVYHRTGHDMFPTPEYWNSLIAFDTPELSGNDNGKIDTGELALALTYAQINENLYAIYDANMDGKMTKPEAQVMLTQLGFADKRVVDFFFSDLALEGKEPGFWRKLKIFFTGVGGADQLGPFEFYKRIVKVLPGVLAGKPITPRRGD